MAHPSRASKARFAVEVSYIPGARVLNLGPTKTFGRLASDAAARLPQRFSARIWTAVVLGFVLAYGFLFTVVHPYVDTRTCVAQLPDPLFALLRYDARWFRVSHELFYAVTAASLVALGLQVARGEHRPLLRFGLGISLQAPLRALTMALLPLCRATCPPGTAARATVPMMDLGFVKFPWLTWATNDLVFSGHVAEFLILYLAVRAFWPRSALLALIVFQVLEALALIITRGHYTIDIVIAIPFALLADRMAVALLARTARLRSAP
jgi:PAP2 superfamily protein